MEPADLTIEEELMKEETQPLPEQRVPIAFYQTKYVSITPQEWKEISKIRDIFNKFVAIVNDIENVAIKTGDFLPVFKEDIDTKTNALTQEFINKHNLNQEPK